MSLKKFMRKETGNSSYDSECMVCQNEGFQGTSPPTVHAVVVWVMWSLSATSLSCKDTETRD